MPSRHAIRQHWPLLVLFASIALTATAGYDAQRVVRTQRSLVERALRDYANFAAWSYAQHLSEYLDSVDREVFRGVEHGTALHVNPSVPPASILPHFLPWDSACGCHRTLAGPSPDAFVAVSLRTHAANVDINTVERSFAESNAYRARQDPLAHESGGGNMDFPTAAGAGVDEPFQWLTDSLGAHIRARPAVDGSFGLFVDARPVPPRVVAYTLMPTSWDDTIVYGAVYSPEAWRRMLASVLDSRALLPEAFTVGKRNRDLLAIAIRDRAGKTLFASDSITSMRRAAVVDLSQREDSLQVEAAIRPDAAGLLLVGGLPASRLPFLLALLAIAGALSIVAVVQLRREGELARLRAEFVSSVSHELRTPVAQIRLFVETLRLGRTRSVEQQNWAVSNIERETARLGYLVENVLRFGSLHEPATATPEPIDVAAAVRDVVGEFESMAAARRASLQFEARATTPLAIPADALRHIVANLLDNALKYGPPDQTIVVSVTRSNGAIVIAIEDEGPGVDASERAMIWRPFARGRASFSKGGSGIGLTIVRRLAEAHGGSTAVESGARGGARFVVSLPVGEPYTDGGVA